MHNAIFFCHLFHMRALQNLQKAKLKLLGTKCINIIEGPVKAVIILVRKTSDQIQMLVNILKTVDAFYNPCQLRKIHSPVDSTNSVRICGLYTDFQLDQPGRMVLISSSSFSLNRSAEISKWKLVIPLSWSFMYCQMVIA